MNADITHVLNYFCLVAELKSFTQAAKQLALSPSALSQAIQSLEVRLNIRLLNRTTRSVGLTDAGQQLYLRLRPTLNELDHILDDVKRQHQKPSGILKIATSYIAWQALIYPKFQQFTEAYPDIALDIQINDGLIDLITEGFDIGIRSSRTLHDSMVAVPFGVPIKCCVIASPAYIAQYGYPTTPEALHQHQCIGYRFISSQQLFQWQFSKGDIQLAMSYPYKYIVNTEQALLQLVEQHKGFAYVFATENINKAIAAKQLVSVLPDWLTSISSQYYIYYPNRKFISQRMRAFIEFFKS